MFSKFFINRPITASVLAIIAVLVLSIITVLGGLLAVHQWRITHNPRTLEVSAVYPGANAKIVADTVAAPIEQEVRSVLGMENMSSQCTDDGKYTLTITFKPGTDLEMAQVLVENHVALASPNLPDPVKRHGVTTKIRESGKQK